MTQETTDTYIFNTKDELNLFTHGLVESGYLVITFGSEIRVLKKDNHTVVIKYYKGSV